jgi:hypothetical protein
MAEFDAEAVEEGFVSERARELAAQCWCDPKTSDRIMDHVLCEVVAKKFDQFLEALQWCSGSEDFQIGGKAREGWEKLCVPLLTHQDPQPVVDGEPRPR